MLCMSVWFGREGVPPRASQVGQAEALSLSWFPSLQFREAEPLGVLLCLDSGSHCIAHADLKFTILPQLPKRQD